MMILLVKIAKFSHALALVIDVVFISLFCLVKEECY